MALGNSAQKHKRELQQRRLQAVTERADDSDARNEEIARRMAQLEAALNNVIARQSNPVAQGSKAQEARANTETVPIKSRVLLCACLGKNNKTNVQRTPGGLLYIRQWNNVQYVSTAAFLLTVYSDFLQATHRKLNCDKGQVGPEELLAFSKSQVDYILGSNPMAMSYLVGYGSNYPPRVHHRGASIDSSKKNRGFIGCTQGYDNWYGRKDSNPNAVVGALVGGPDGNDGFRDQRWNFMQTEACTFNTAALVGVFAKLRILEGDGNVSLHQRLITSS